MVNAFEYIGGTYELKNNAWYCNGKLLPKPVQIVSGMGITITKIEGVYVNLEKGSPMSRQVIPTDGSDIYLAPGFYRINVVFNENTQAAKGKQSSGKATNDTYEYAQDFEVGFMSLRAFCREVR